MLNEVLAKLHISNPEELRVTTDSRNCPRGSIFIGLKGEHFDGNQYATQALINGAELVICDNPESVCCITPDKYILVDNSLLALQSLARDWREYLAIPIIGITGTNGKTTTKELTATVLKQKYAIHYTQGNLNNQIGVPLTILQINKSHEMAIIEMGASHIGDIKELVDIAEPNFGLITNVGKAHLEGFGSFEGVKATKGELYDYLREHNGRIFINNSDPNLMQMAKGLDYTEYINAQIIAGSANLQMEVEGNTLVTNLIGTYNADNVRAALTIGKYFGVSIGQGMKAIESYIPTNNRSMLKRTEHNTLIVDAYNANATSMDAAIKSFATSDLSDKVLILGDMLELGKYATSEHQELVKKIETLGFKDVILIGENFYHTNTPFAKFISTPEFEQYLAGHPFNNKTILLKGSRGIKLETLIPLL